MHESDKKAPRKKTTGSAAKGTPKPRSGSKKAAAASPRPPEQGLAEQAQSAAGRGGTTLTPNGATVPGAREAVHLLKAASLPGSERLESATGAAGRLTSRPGSTPESKTQRWLTPEERHRMIALKAYLRAESRSFRNGTPEQDWFAAEAEVDSILLRLQHTRNE